MMADRHFKVYLSLYRRNSKNDKDIRIERDERDKIISKLVESNPHIFDHNSNKNKDKHLPLYYDETYYFGDPIVLTGVSEANLSLLLIFFKSEGLRYWITHLNEMYSFRMLHEFIGNLKMENNNDERKLLFVSKDNLVNEYKDHYAVIQDNITISSIIEATK